jgi:hypothetical protein
LHRTRAAAPVSVLKLGMNFFEGAHWVTQVDPRFNAFRTEAGNEKTR